MCLLAGSLLCKVGAQDAYTQALCIIWAICAELLACLLASWAVRFVPWCSASQLVDADRLCTLLHCPQMSWLGLQADPATTIEQAVPITEVTTGSAD